MTTLISEEGCTHETHHCELLELNAVVGAKADITPDGKMTRFGVTCAIWWNS